MSVLPVLMQGAPDALRGERQVVDLDADRVSDGSLDGCGCRADRRLADAFHAEWTVRGGHLDVARDQEHDNPDCQNDE